MFDLLGRTLDGVARWVAELANLFLIGIVVLINVEIFVRYFFHSSTLLAEELTGYLLCWLTLFGFLQVARRDQFIRVEFGTVRLNARWRNAAAIVAALCGLFVSLVVCYTTWQMVANSFRFHAVSNQQLATPLYLPQLAMPIAFGLLCVGHAEEVIRRLLRPVEIKSEEAQERP